MRTQHGSFNAIAGPNLVRLDSGSFALRWGGTTHSQGTLASIAWSVRSHGLSPLPIDQMDTACLTADERRELTDLARRANEAAHHLNSWE